MTATMELLGRPSETQIEDEVVLQLQQHGALRFPDLEERVHGKLKGLANPILVRQAAWRMINRGKAQLAASSMQVALKTPSASN